eukprot:1074943-Prymnesium_polylepis.1
MIVTLGVQKPLERDLAPGAGISRCSGLSGRECANFVAPGDAATRQPDSTRVSGPAAACAPRSKREATDGRGEDE